MPDTLTITPGFLRQAIRDARYWREGHPERQAYSDWLTGAFRALHAEQRQDGASGPVQVRAYTRTPRHLNRPQHVGAHARGRPHGGGRGTERVAYRPRDENGLPAPLGTRPQPQIGGGAPVPGTTSLRPSPTSLDGLRGLGRMTRDSPRTRIRDLNEGEAQMRADFGALGPRNVQTHRNGTVVGELDGGATINMRLRSSDGRPTIEVQTPGRGPTGIYYE